MYQGQPSTRPVNAVSIIGHAFTLSGQHAATVFGTSLIVQFAVLALSFLAINTFGALGVAVWVLLYLAVYQVSMGIYTLLLLHLRHGHDTPSIGYLLSESGKFAGPLLWLGVLSSVGIGIGMVLLFVPGFILSLMWAVAAPALVASRIPATEALSVSRQLTKGAMGTVFVLVVIQGFLMNILPNLLTASSPTMAAENTLIVQGMVAAITTPIVAIASAELFLRLAGVPDRIVDASPPAPTPSGPYVSGAPVPTGSPIAAATAAAQPYAGQPRPYAGQPQPYGAPPAPQPYAAPPRPAAPPMPGLAGPPAAAQRERSVAPPGMG